MWIDYERRWPMLAAFRTGSGSLESLTEPDDDTRNQAILAAVLPKLGNIMKARAAIEDGDLNPLTLGPVVEMTRLRMHVPPGSIRAKLIESEVSEASEMSFRDIALMVITIGLAILAAIPSGGSSLVVGAEIVGLAIDAYLLAQEWEDYQIADAAANTDIDMARSLSDQEPSLTGFVIQLVSLPIGGAGVLKAFREARALREAAALGQHTDEAVRALDKFGRDNGLGDVGSRIVDDTPVGTKVVRKTSTGLYSDVVTDVAADNADGVARRVGVPVEVDDSLGSGVKLDYRIGPDGDVVIKRMRVGRAASTADAIAHARTKGLMQRYNGLWGKLRELFDELVGLFGGRGALKPGSEAWEAWLETEKLGRLVRSRQTALMQASGDAVEVLQAEIDFLQRHVDDYQALVASGGKAPTKSAGSIASPDLGVGSRPMAADDLVDKGTFQHSRTAGITTAPKGAKPPPIPSRLKGVVKRLSKGGDIVPEDEARRFLPRNPGGASTADLRSRIAKASYERAEKALAELEATPTFAALRKSNPDQAQEIANHLQHTVAQNYFAEVEKGAIKLRDKAEKKILEKGDSAAAEDYVAADTVVEATAVRPVGGRLPLNHQYAGSYFPKEQLPANLRQLCDNVGLPGIPITRTGEPDFTPWIYRTGGVTGDVDIGRLTGKYDGPKTDPGDFQLADKKAGFTKANPRPDGYTWHHHEGSRLILVPTDIHHAYQHAGPAALFRGVTGTDAYR
jgi:hypothetical protein